MIQSNISSQHKFLEGGGQMGALVRSFNWAESPIGPITSWPESLRTIVSTCLNTRFPMQILWGESMIHIYNDSYIPIAGSKHPSSFGMPAVKIWPEIWDTVGPMLEGVYKGGDAIWSEDHLLILNRNEGFPEECYFDFSYSPIRLENGEVGGILITVIETTEKIKALKKLEENEKNFRNLVMQAPVGICILKGEDFFVELANDIYLEIARKKRNDFVSKPLWEGLPEAKSQGFDDLLKGVLRSGIPFRSEEFKVELLRNGISETAYISFVYEPMREADGTIQRIMVVVNEITDQVLARMKVEESEKEFRQLADSLPQLVWTTDKEGKQLFASRRWKEFTGLEAIDQHAWQQMVHPKDSAGVGETFAESLATGKPYRTEVRLRNKKNEYEWHYVLGEPIYNDKGEIEKWSGAFTNVNDQKLAEESLKLQAQVLESMDEGVSVSDENGFILFTNSAEDRMFGYETGELIGKHVTTQNAYPKEENIQTVSDVIRQVTLQGSWTGEWYNRKKDGSTFFTHSHISAIDVGDKKLMVCVQRNITEEKAYKEQLKRFKFMADNASDPFILIREDGTFAYLNDLALERWGYTREEAPKLHTRDVEPGYDPQKFTDIFLQAQKERIAPIETLHKRKDGTLYPVEINMGGLVLDAKPYLFAVARDITERKKAREELNLSLKRFQLMSDTMAQFVWTADPLGKLNYFNRAVFDYSGLSFEALQADGWLQMIHPDDHAENISRWAHSMRTGDVFIFQHRFFKKNGEFRWQLSRAIPQYDSEGNIQLWVGTSTDIHDHKLFEEKLAKEVADRTQELRNTNQELQKSNAELEQFAYVASHDLQEPLRKIRTFASMLAEKTTVLSEKENGYLNKIMASSERMSALINDILNFSKLAQTDVSYVPVDLNEILKNILQDMEMEIEEKNVFFQIDTLPVIEAIPVQMNQLFFNLVSNSLKFAKENTPPEISIKVNAVPRSRNEDYKNLNKTLRYIEIIFADNGIGFDQQFGEKIFNIFQRLNNRTYAGSGIGLALCRRIVHTHHGEIFAESSENEGAAFHIFLPLTRTEDQNG